MDRAQVSLQKNVNENEIALIYEVKAEILKICSDKNKLNKYTYYTLNKIRWFFYEDTCNGSSAMDVLQIIFEKFLIGKRKWYKKEGNNFENQLFMTIHSYIRNQFNKNYKREINEETGEATIERKGPMIFSIFDAEGYTNEVLLKDEKNFLEELENETKTENEIEEQIEKVRQLLKNDEEAFYVFDELLKNSNSDLKTSKALGLSIEKVRNAKKRIRRKSKEIFTLKTK